jgi:hypothetical protein
MLVYSSIISTIATNTERQDKTFGSWESQPMSILSMDFCYSSVTSETFPGQYFKTGHYNFLTHSFL